jgi:hypothetical protein
MILSGYALSKPIAQERGGVKTKGEQQTGLVDKSFQKIYDSIWHSGQKKYLVSEKIAFLVLSSRSISKI